MINAIRALVKSTPVTSIPGLLPNFPMIKSDSLLERPVFIIAAARIKAPSMKKTAELPKSEYAVFSSITPRSGREAMTKMPVTESGIAAVAHKITAITNIAIVLCPCRDRPSGVGKTAITNRSIKEKTNMELFLRLALGEDMAKPHPKGI
jgi:hypothetical protein